MYNRRSELHGWQIHIPSSKYKWLVQLHLSAWLIVSLPDIRWAMSSFLWLSSDSTSKAATCPLFTELCSMMLSIRKVCQILAALKLEPTVSFKWNATTPSVRNTSGLCHYFVHLSFPSSAFQCKHSLLIYMRILNNNMINIYLQTQVPHSSFLWPHRSNLSLHQVMDEGSHQIKPNSNFTVCIFKWHWRTATWSWLLWSAYGYCCHSRYIDLAQSCYHA